MERKFDFDEVGKSVPYRVPEGFYDEMQKSVLAKVAAPKRKKGTILRFLPIASAVAAVFVGVLYISVHVEDSTSNISQAKGVDMSWIENISDEDLESLNEVTNYDIFID